LVDRVDENTKGSEPAEGDENVHWITALVPRSKVCEVERTWPREQARRKGNQPEETE
jgi:hypothetical protein